MNIIRHIDSDLKSHFERYDEIAVILGSRQSGKTTLVKRLFPDARYLLADNEPVKRFLESYDASTYRSILQQNNQIIIIDEMHQLSDPGRAAKILLDELKCRLIVTGSSSFHIRNRTAESLAGRKIDYLLFPLTFSEYLFQIGLEDSIIYWPERYLENSDDSMNPKLYDFRFHLDNVLLHGLYPGMLNHPSDTRYLMNFVDSLVFKDIIDFGLIENRRAGIDLLKLLAYQAGNMINYAELSDKLQIDQRTVKRYIEIFEQSFIIFRLYPFLGNRRDEIVKSPKIYFYDTGVRNAIISDFSDIALRPDSGRLFENFVISEFVKANHYRNSGLILNYWRTKSGSEVDLIVQNGKAVTAIEIKFNSGSISQAFANRFPDAGIRVLTVGNYFKS